MRHGKKYRSSAETIAGRAKETLGLREAVALVKGAAKAKFDETVEVASHLGVDPRHSDQLVRGTVVLIAAVNLAFTGPTSVGLAWLADNRFEGGSAAFGFLFAAWGGGALIGAVIGGSVTRVPRLGTVMLVVAMLIGVAFALVGLAPNVAIASAAPMLSPITAILALGYI